MELTKEFRFEASHILPKHPGKCSRLHGHSWVLKVSVKGKVHPETGFVMDYAEISEVVKPIIDSLDHRHLGQWVSEEAQMRIPTDVFYSSLNKKVGTDHQVFWLSPEFYPSSENLLLAIADRLTPDLNWSKLELNETCTSSAILTREEFDRYHRQ